MRLNNFFFKKEIVGFLNCMALLLVAQTANVACLWIFHQPEFPKEANKFKKISK